MPQGVPETRVRPGHLTQRDLDRIEAWNLVRAARHAERRRRARVSTDDQDLTAQRDALAALGVAPERIYVGHGLTGTNRDRPGLREAMAACRAGDVLVVTKLDRLARSLPDARDIVAELTARDVALSLGGSAHDPTDPVGRLLFNVLAMVAEFESDLARMRTREGMKVARAKGRLRGRQPKLSPRQEAHLVALHGAGEHTISELEELFTITRSTVYRALARDRTRATTSSLLCPWGQLRESWVRTTSSPATANPSNHRPRSTRGHSIGRCTSMSQKSSLTALAREQLELARAASSGRSAHIVFGGHEHVLHQTLIALVADHGLDEHDSPDDATVHVLHGRVRLRAGADSWEGSAGDLLAVPAARHTLDALEDSAVVLTVGKRR